MYTFSYLEPVCCSMSSSNCCFLTCIQVSQEAGQVVWYSHLLQNFPHFIVIHTVKGFGIVSKAEIDVFLELSCFFDDPEDVGNLISGSSAFSKTEEPEIKLPTYYSSLTGWAHTESCVSQATDRTEGGAEIRPGSQALGAPISPHPASLYFFIHRSSLYRSHNYPYPDVKMWNLFFILYAQFKQMACLTWDV